MQHIQTTVEEQLFFKAVRKNARGRICPNSFKPFLILKKNGTEDYFIYTSAILQHSTIPISISRVNQFDAARLDIEMSAMLKEQLVKVFSLMKECYFNTNQNSDAFLEFLIWRFSIWVDKPTPGIALMNLRYRDERAVALRGKVRTGLEGPGLTLAQKMWYCVAAVGGLYIWARLQSFSAFCRWVGFEQRPLAWRAWGLMQRIEGLCKAASFGNLLIFLYTGM
ncbi:hypothetical protein J1N35_039367 [Gossypium stocksii]|uniref:RING-type E3 ubiquitin transferase (cysteine targeting) n=1 Tax=Gossypium stocksii TaxID=47602 RepID=A0A9D3UNM0_9ROSI|nr:hypothetical protein J1N35_039367 [Gossypium stocksii]